MTKISIYINKDGAIMNKENKNISVKNIHCRRFRSIIILLSTLLFFLFTVSLKLITNFFADEINSPPKNTVNIETSDNIKVYNTNNEPIEEISISSGESYRYIVEVDDSYTQNQITSSYTPTDENGQKIQSLTQNISPSQVLSDMDITNLSGSTVDYQTFAGAITMQGDQAIYDTDSIKKYWVYNINNISSPGIISVYGADQANTSTIGIGGIGEDNILVKDLYEKELLKVIDPYTQENIIGKSFTTGSIISFNIILDSQFNDSGFEVKLISKDSIDTNTGKIKETDEAKREYNYSIPLRLNNNQYSPLLKKDSVIYISNIEKSKYTVTFNAENADIEKVGTVSCASDITPQNKNNLKEIKIALGQQVTHGQILTFSIDLEDSYDEIEGKTITPVIDGSTNGINKIDENTNLWKVEGINANTTITFKYIELRKININVTKPTNSIIGDTKKITLDDQENIKVDYGSNCSLTIYPEDGYSWKNNEIAISATANGTSYKCEKYLDGDVWHLDIREQNNQGLKTPKNISISLTINGTIQKNDEPSEAEAYTATFGGNENVNVQEVEYSPVNTATLKGSTIINQEVIIKDNSLTRPEVTIPKQTQIIINDPIIATYDNNGDPKIEGKLSSSGSITLPTTQAITTKPMQNDDGNITFQYTILSESISSYFGNTPFKIDYTITSTNENKSYDAISSQDKTLSELVSSIKIKGALTANKNEQTGETTYTVASCTADIEFNSITVSYKEYTLQGEKSISIPIISNVSGSHAKLSNAGSPPSLPASTTFSGTLAISDVSDAAGTGATVTTSASEKTMTFKTSSSLPINISNGAADGEHNFTINLTQSNIQMTDSKNVTSTITPIQNKKFDPSEKDFTISTSHIISGTITGKITKTTSTGSTKTTTYTLEANSCKANIVFTSLSFPTKYYTIVTNTPSLSINALKDIDMSTSNMSVKGLDLTIGKGTSFTIPKDTLIASQQSDLSQNKPKIDTKLTDSVEIKTCKDISIKNISLTDLSFEVQYDQVTSEDFTILSDNTEIQFLTGEENGIYCSNLSNQPFGINSISKITIHGKLSNNNDGSYTVSSCKANIVFSDLSVNYSTLKILNDTNIKSLSFDKTNNQNEKYVLVKKPDSSLSDLNLNLLSGRMNIENLKMEDTFDNLPGSIFKLSNVESDCNILKTDSTDKYLYFKSNRQSNLKDLVDIKYAKDKDAANDSVNWKTYSFDNLWGINDTSNSEPYSFSITAKGANSIQNIIVTVENDANTKLSSNEGSSNQKFYDDTKSRNVTIINIENIGTMNYKVHIPTKEGLIFKNALNGENLSNIVSATEQLYIVLEAENGYYFPIKYDDSNNLLFDILTIPSSSNAQIKNISMMSNDEIIGYQTNIYDINGDIELSLDDSLTPIKSSHKVYLISPDNKIVFKGISGYLGEKLDPDGNFVQQDIPFKGQDHILVEDSDELKFGISNSSSQKILVTSGLITSLEELSPTENVYKLRITENNTVIKVEKLQPNSYVVNFNMEDKSIGIDEAIQVQATDGVDITSISTPVAQGEDLTFKITAKGKYSQSIPIAKVSNKPLANTISDNGITFILKDVQADTTITISDIVVNSYDVLFESDQVTFFDTNTGSQLNDTGSILKHGSSLKFYIVPDSGYDIKSATFTISNIDESTTEPKSKINIISQAQGQYEIQNVQEAVIVHADVELDQYTLSFQKDIDNNNEQKFKVLQDDDPSQDITSTGKMLRYGEIFTFKIELNSKYDKSDINISLSNPDQGRILDLSSNGIFKYQIQIYGNNLVTVNNITLNNYQLNLKQSSNVMQSLEIYDSNKVNILDTQNVMTIVHGNTFSFSVKSKYGFEISSSAVYIGPSDADFDGEENKFNKLTASLDGEYYMYTTPKITEDSKIVMVELKKKVYSVGFEGQFVIFKQNDENSSEITQNQQVEHGSPFSFKLYPEEGYNLSKINVTTNTGSKITLNESNDEYNIYTIDSVKENLVVIVSGSRRNEYQIIFQQGEVKSGNESLTKIPLSEILSIHEESGNILKNDGELDKLYGIALHGYDYKFKISLNDEFSRSKISLLTQISSEPIQKTQNGSGYTTQGPQNGADATSYDEETGYWILSGKNIDGKQIIITINNIEVNKYKIDFSGEGIDFKNGSNIISSWNKDTNKQELPDGTSSPTIEHTLDDMSNNSNAHIYQIEITPQVDDGYSLDENLRVYSSNGTITRDTKKPDQWIYNISSVTNDTTIYVEGVKSILYRIDFVDKDSSFQRFKVYNQDNKNITSGVRLAHGENLSFKIALDDAYTQSIIQVHYDKNNDGTLSNDEIINIENGFYKFNNISENSKIIVSNIKVNTYTITFNQDSRITFKNASGSTINSTDNIEVEHGSKYLFNVESNTGYNLSSAFISATNATAVKDEKNSTDTKLVITLSDIVGTSSVSVNGITINLYSVKFQDKNSNPIANAIVYSYPTDRDITSGTQTYFNKELKFKVELKEGYTNSQITVSNSLTPNNKIDKDDQGYYSITITQDTLINIDGIKINRYDITLSAEDDLTQNQVNFSKVGASEEIIPLPYEDVTTLKEVVEHGANYSFLATANKGFTLSDLKISVNGSDVEFKVDTKNGLSQATITLIGVTKNLSVEKDQSTGLSKYENPVRISNTKKEKYTVNFSGEEMNNVTILDKDSLKDITRSGKEVLYGENLSIIANPHTGYDQSIVNWVFTGTDSDRNNVAIEKIDSNTWQIKNVGNDVTVTLSGIHLNTYNLTFEGPDVEFRDRVTNNDISSQNPSVTHGGYFTFKVVAKEGFDLEGSTISTTAGKLTEENKSIKEAVYTLSDIDSSPKIVVKVFKSNIDIKLVESEGIVYHEPAGATILTGIQTRPYGDTFSFSVSAEYGYDLSTLVVKFGDTVLTPSNINDETEYYRYETPAVKEDTNITASINKKKYKITLPTADQSEGIKFFENNKPINHETLIMIEYGGKFQFTTQLDDKHNQSSVTIKANDETINFINGSYTLSDISTDINITVEGIEINRYKVNLSESVGAQYENVSIDMSNISGVYIVPYSGEISFSVSAKAGYELSQIVVVCKEDNGTAVSLSPKDNKYTIKNITSNKTISIQNVKEVQYKVSFEPTSGVTYKNDQGLVVTDPVYVSHGNNFEFQVSISDEYDDSVPVVKTTSATIGAQKLSAGKYMLSDVTEDLTIQVLNVSKNKYTVTLTKITGITYKDQNGKTLDSESQKVEYNDDFKFQVYIQPAYNDSVITVMLGKDNMATENGVYIIRGIKEDKTVTVTGITENEETLLINTITKLSDKVESNTDVDAIIQATKRYNQLSDAKKALISNYDKLQSLQQLSGEYSHVTNDIKISGIPWNIKLVAVTLSTNTDACSRIYDKLSSEFILSLYDIYLVDMLTGQKYELPAGEKVIVTIPTPDLKYFKDPLIVHEISSTGKIEYLIMSINGDTSSFEMTSFSTVGVAAKKSLNSGSSSLFDTIGDGINNIRDMITNMVNGGGAGQNSNMSNGSESGSSSSSGNGNDSWDDSVQSNGSNSIFGGSTNVTSGSGSGSSGSGLNSNNGSSNNSNNKNNNGLISQFMQDGSGIIQGSAIKLILILILGIIIAILTIIVIKRLYPKNKNSKKPSGKTDTKLPPENKDK